MKQCLSPYDIFDYVGSTNLLLTNAASESMGGSLAERLTCDDEVFPTYYSERKIPEDKLKGLHFVELRSKDKPSSAEYTKIRFFTREENHNKIKDIIDLEDKNSN